MKKQANKIFFITSGQNFLPKNRRNLKIWFEDTIKNENKNFSEITFVFCSAENMLELNKKYLNHNTHTDIITFDYSEDNVISGDICLNIQMIKDNSKTFKTTFVNEVNRVMVHGILHLCGYKDKTEKEKSLMRKKEDFYLEIFKKYTVSRET